MNGRVGIRGWRPRIPRILPGVASAAVLAVSGCVDVPREAPRERPLEPHTLGLSGADYVAPTEGWWLAFDDPQLDQLVADALARNPGLAGALARVRSAEAQARAVGATGDPQASFDAAAYRQRISEHYIFPPPFAGSSLWQGQLGVNLAWNLDFWGRQAAMIGQSQRLAEAVRFEAAGAGLLLSSAVAQSYVEFVRARRMEEVAGQAAVQRQRIADLTRERVDAGLDTHVELLGAEGGLARVGVDREQARLAQASAVHALATLTGHGAGAAPLLAAPRLDLEQALVLPESLPADLLAHRPDVAAAQQRVLAARAGSEVAAASFYPNVNLLAFAGFEAIGLDQLLDAGSRALSIGPAIHLPLFDGGRLRAEYSKAGADWDAAVAAYNETVLRAVREVADQLSRLQSLDRQLADQLRSLDAAEGAYRLAEQRYSAGLASYLTVLNAETQVLEARRLRVQLLADRTLARVALLVALGGNFQESTG